MQRTTRRRAVPVLWLALALTVTSCGADREEEVAPGAGSQASAPTAAPEGTAEESPSPSPEQAWPDGQVIDLEVATVRVPRSWGVSRMPVGVSYSADAPGGLAVLVAALPTLGDLDETDEVQIPLSEMERRMQESERDNRTFRQLERREVNGVLMAQATNTRASWSALDLAVEHADKEIRFNFMVRGEVPPVGDELVEQILSTVEWGEDQP